MQRRMRLGLMQACAGASKLYPVQTQDRAPADPRPGFVKGHKTPGLSRGDRTVGGPVASVGGPVTGWEALMPCPLCRSHAAFPDLSA